MATNGNVARLKLDSKLVNQETSSDFGSKLSPIETTSKTSGGVKEQIMGLKEYTLSAEAIFDKVPSSPTEVYAKTMIDWFEARTLVAFEYALSATSGDVKYTGNLYISDLSFKSAANDKVTYSVTYAITGAVTVGTV